MHTHHPKHTLYDFLHLSSTTIHHNNKLPQTCQSQKLINYVLLLFHTEYIMIPYIIVIVTVIVIDEF